MVFLSDRSERSPIAFFAWMLRPQQVTAIDVQETGGKYAMKFVFFPTRNRKFSLLLFVVAHFR